MSTMMFSRVAVLLLVKCLVIESSHWDDVKHRPCAEGQDSAKQLEDTCYEFVLEERRSYHDAQLYCQILGGHLAMVKNENIQNFIVNHLNKTYNFDREVIIGLNDIEEEGVWRWEDGTESTYQNWAPVEGYGKFIGRTENCAAIDPTRNGQWADIVCKDTPSQTEKRAFICEFETDSSNPDTAVEPDTSNPDTGVEPDTSSPDTVVEPDASNPDTALEPDTSNPDTVVEPETSNPDTAVEPDTSNPDTVVEPDTSNPDTVVEPDTSNPGTVVDPDISNPDTVVEPVTSNPDTVVEPDSSNPDDVAESDIADEAESESTQENE